VEATEEGTDRWAIEQGFVSMTPITLDLTDREALQRVRKLESWKQLKFA
jgi:5'-nucleotidase